MLNLLVIIPAHHQGSYKYECPPEPDDIMAIKKCFHFNRNTKQISLFHRKRTTIKLHGNGINEIEPALVPEFPAFLRPFFLIIKLDPIKMLEDKAKTNPWTLSDDIPIEQIMHKSRIQILQGQDFLPESLH